MEGHLTLIDIQIPETGLHVSLDDPEQLYDGVQGTFCHISWDLQTNHPRRYPTFYHLQQGSFLCSGTMVTLDLWDVVRHARQYDFRNHTFAATKPREEQLPVPPTLVIFHQSKSGATVLSNTLAGFAPRHTRVYADAIVVTKALRACQSSGTSLSTTTTTLDPSCDTDSQLQLVQDIFYLLGRISRHELPQYVFYKVDPAAAFSVDVFVRALPHAPWLFVYRDGTEIVMSHFEHYQRGENVPRNYHDAACLDGFGTTTAPGTTTTSIPSAMVDLVKSHQRTVESLTREEYCAAWVASLGKSVLQQHRRTDHQLGGVAALQPKFQPTPHHPLHHIGALYTPEQTPHWLLQYEHDLPHALWESVLPQLLVGGDLLTPTEKERLKGATRGHATRGEDGGWFLEDSTIKRGRAPLSVQQAVALFADPVYARLEKARSALLGLDPGNKHD